MARTTRQDSSLVPGWVEPMLAKPDGGLLREGPEWAYEYNWTATEPACRSPLTARRG
jgi:bifunctional non-homologous end joining protein LigD